MAKRYNNIDIINSDLGVKYYKNVIYPKIPNSESDIYVITVRGDRFDSLAYQFYNDVNLWWIISISNEALPQNSMFIPIGTQLRIPQNTSDIIREYNSLNEF